MANAGGNHAHQHFVLFGWIKLNFFHTYRFTCCIQHCRSGFHELSLFSIASVAWVAWTARDEQMSLQTGSPSAGTAYLWKAHH
jgi:hypothetical protein